MNKTQFKVMRSRISGSNGFSLSELLLTVIILLLATSIVAAAMPSMVRYLDSIITIANSETLLSTAMVQIRDELDKCVEVEVKKQEDGTYTLEKYRTKESPWKSLDFGDELKIRYYTINSINNRTLTPYSYDSGGAYAESGAAGAISGTTVIQGTRLAHRDNLQIRVDSITYNKSGKTFTISGLAAYRSSNPNEAVVTRDPFTVKIYNTHVKDNTP